MTASGRVAGDPIACTGTAVVTYDDDQPVVRDGAVYIGPDGTIDAVQPRRRAARPASHGPARSPPAAS